MIKKGASVKEEYYVAPSLNELVLKQKKVGVYKINENDYFNLNGEDGKEEYENYLRGVK